MARDNKSIRPGGGSKQVSGRIGLLIFGCMFFGMGALFCWMMGLNPLLKSLGSKDWVETKCEILSSAVKTHDSSDGDTYSIEISFSYEVNGQAYVSNTYNFDDSSSSGRSGKAKVVSQYPKGSQQICWVDPDNPRSAVISRDIPRIVFIIIPFTSIFMLIGMGALLGAIGLLPKRWKLGVGNQHQPVSTQSSGTQVLKPSSSGIGKVIGTTFAAIFWNGITGVFVTIAVQSHLSGNPEWFLTVFIIPFVLIGIGLIFAIFHSLLALANPKLELTLSEASPRLGEPVQLEWNANKPLHRLRTLTIQITGQEAATYRRGTDSVTDRSIFHQEVLLELDQPASQQRGILKLSLPIDSMHSFDSGNNQIEWQLEVEGEIPRYPDIKDQYPITVRPLSNHLDSHR